MYRFLENITHFSLRDSHQVSENLTLSGGVPWLICTASNKKSILKFIKLLKLSMLQNTNLHKLTQIQFMAYILLTDPCCSESTIKI